MGRNRPKGGLLGGSDILRIPDAPTISATAGNAQIEVAFTNPSDVGGGAITSYTALALEGSNLTTASSSTTPVTITGLSNGTSYSVTGTANNDFGASVQSSASSVTPVLITQEIGLFFNGFGSSQINQIDKITITSAGNATDFGDTSAASRRNCAFGGATRGIVHLGNIGAGGYSVTLEYVTFSTTGDTTDFGDLSVGRWYSAALTNPTRGVVGGGDSSSGRSNVMDYVTIASAGNATDFGD